MKNEQLRQNAAAMIAHAEGKPIQCRSGGGNWVDMVLTPRWTFDVNEYRPKPEPVSRPWRGPADVPLNCWIQSSTQNANEGFFVCGIVSDGVRVQGRTGIVSWTELAGLWVYSMDRKEWRKCEVIEEAQ